MGGQGLLLLMEFKFLIMMTRLQNITVAYSKPATVMFCGLVIIIKNLNSINSRMQATVMFCGLVIIIKNFNSINSRRPWPPILISHLFQHSLFLDSWPQLFLHQGYFGWDTNCSRLITCSMSQYSYLGKYKGQSIS